MADCSVVRRYQILGLMTEDTCPREGMPDPRISRAELKRRFRLQYQDQVFDELSAELERLAEAAWQGYCHSRKSPRTQKAGVGFADPNYDISVDWLAARHAVQRAQQQHDDPSTPANFLLVNCSSRSEHTCPGEMSKSYRLVELAREVLASEGERASIDLLDLSRLASEYGRRIYPCKGCFSTAAPLCYWPCSGYPNYALGQTQDWMDEIYPLWVAAHGILVITPVHWFQVSSPLKLMMDRLVCADAGNEDPTGTHGKDAQKTSRLSWRVGLIPSICRGGYSPASCTAMRKVRKVCAVASRTG